MPDLTKIGRVERGLIVLREDIVCAENTVYPPVLAAGALLAMWGPRDSDWRRGVGWRRSADRCHHSLQVEVRRRVSLPRPLIETPKESMTCGWGMSMREPAACAIDDVTNLVASKCGLERVEATDLAGLVGNAGPGNCVLARLDAIHHAEGSLEGRH